MKIRQILKKAFAFPRQDLELHWWHRLAKVSVFVSTGLVLILTISWAGKLFKPYNVYSFDDNFSKYSNYRQEDCSINDFCGEDAGQVIFKYEASSDQNKYNYIENLYAQHKTNSDIITQMENDGLLNNLRAVDLQNNFYGFYYEILYIILIPFIWYMLTIHILYRLVAYILVGKKK